MQFCAWDARLSAPVETGGTVRSNAEVAAAIGNPKAIAALQGPPFPEELRGLWDLARKLHGRSGVTMNGLAPMSFETLERGPRLLGYQPLSPDEVEAMLAIDAVMLNPGED